MRRELGSIYETAPGVWRIEVSAGRDPQSGKRLRRTKVVRGTQRDAERVLARLILEVGKAVSSKLTLSEYVEDVWLPGIELRRRTRDEYEGKMRLHVLPALGHVRLDKIEPYLLDRWILTLPKTRTGRHAYAVLRCALNRAVRWRLIEHSPLAATDPPRCADYEPEVLTAEEANAYLDLFAGHELEPIVVLALGAGLRRSELCALEWSDIDLRAATVSITKGRHERKGEVFIEPPKSRNSRRVVSLPAWAVEALKAHRGIGPVTAHKPSKVSSLYKRTIAREDARLKAQDPKAGLRFVPLKQLRHSHATLALASGVDIVTVSRRLGHSTVSITDAFYLRPGRSADQAAAAAIDGMRRRAECAALPAR